jgi:uncharacterized protein (DUF488 family)
MILTVGHSTLSQDEFLALIRDVDTVLDVRSYPGSRRHSHFGREAMEVWLPAAGVGYRWQPALGGRRRAARGASTGPAAAPGAVADTRGAVEHSAGWESPAFAAYALAMAEASWLEAAEELIVWAGAPAAPRVALLCAEAVWWRCHRSMIADYLHWRGLDVLHLQPRPTHHAEVVDDRLGRYPEPVLLAWQAWARRAGRPGGPPPAGAAG